MQDFKGDLLINNGALNLRDLSAGSAIGGAALTALYTAPTKNDIRFGLMFLRQATQDSLPIALSLLRDLEV